MILSDTEGLKAVLYGEIELLVTQEGGKKVLENVVWFGEWLKRAALDARGDAPCFPPYDVAKGLEQIRDMGYMLQASDQAKVAVEQSARHYKSQLEKACQELRASERARQNAEGVIRRQQKMLRQRKTTPTPKREPSHSTSLPTWML